MPTYSFDLNVKNYRFGPFRVKKINLDLSFYIIGPGLTQTYPILP